MKDNNIANDIKENTPENLSLTINNTLNLNGNKNIFEIEEDDIKYSNRIFFVNNQYSYDPNKPHILNFSLLVTERSKNILLILVSEDMSLLNFYKFIRPFLLLPKDTNPLLKTKKDAINILYADKFTLSQAFEIQKTVFLESADKKFNISIEAISFTNDLKSIKVKLISFIPCDICISRFASVIVKINRFLKNPWNRICTKCFHFLFYEENGTLMEDLDYEIFDSK